MRVIAERQLSGDYGTVLPGQEFDVREDLATDLLKRGLVRKAGEMKVEYQTKVITPEAPEVGAREPFRHMPMPHAKPKELVTESDREFSGAELPEAGVADSSGRRGRARSAAGR